MSKRVKIIILWLAIIVIGATGFVFFYTRTAPSSFVGGDRDEHGCVGSAGYAWCVQKQKCLRNFEELCPDQIADLTAKIRDVSDIDFLPKGETAFNWIVYDEETLADKSVVGLLYEAQNVKWAQYEKLEKFLDENHEPDTYNLADGVSGGLRGYHLHYAVCILNFRHLDMQINPDGLAEPAGDNMNVKLECGYFNKNETPKILLEQKIKEILATKYDKAVSEVIVQVTKSTDSHAAGTVVFGTGGAGEGGLFLAVKENNQWRVAFDGSGSVDCEAMRQQYRFPEEILQPEFCD